MKRLYARDGRVDIRDVEPPRLRRGEVMIRTSFSAVSVGTEMWLIEGSADPEFRNHEYPTEPAHWPKTRTPIRTDHPLPRSPDPEWISLGYSLAGEVVEVDDSVVDIEPGDLVAASGSQCAHHAELVAVPRNLVAPVPEDVRLEDAALVTLGSIAITALRTTRCQFGETVVLYGVGLLGLLASMIGSRSGFEMVGIDIEDSRLAIARDLGASHTIEPTQEDATDRVREITDGYGADAVIVGLKSESSQMLNEAFDMCRQRGRVVAQGLFGMEIDRARFYANQVELAPSIGYGLGRYDPAYEEGNADYPIGLARWTENRNQAHFLSLLGRDDVDLSQIAPVTFDIDNASEAYELLRRTDRPPTVLFRYTTPV